jgi:outer membrane protein assembly factor BamB
MPGSSSDAGRPGPSSDAGRPGPNDLGADLGTPSDGPTQATNFRIDAAHTGGQPRETMAPPLTLAWSVDFGAPVSYPLVADGRVFVTAGTWNLDLPPGSVAALDRATGTMLWGPLALGNEPYAAYDRGVLFVDTFDGAVFAVDAANGQTKWSVQLYPPRTLTSPPVAADGVVYIQGNALDGETGNLLWRASYYGTDGAVAVKDGVLYEGESCGQASAVDVTTGQQLWHQYLGCGGGGGSTPAVYGGRMYFRLGTSRSLVGGDEILDVTTGKLVGTFLSGDPPAFDNGIGYYLESGTLSAVAVDTGSVAWSFVGDGKLTTAPIVAGAYVYVGSSGGNLYALDGAGQAVWNVDVGGRINADAENESMVVAEATLLVPVGNRLLAFH